MNNPTMNRHPLNQTQFSYLLFKEWESTELSPDYLRFMRDQQQSNLYSAEALDRLTKLKTQFQEENVVKKIEEVIELILLSKLQ